MYPSSIDPLLRLIYKNKKKQKKRKEKFEELAAQ